MTTIAIYDDSPQSAAALAQLVRQQMPQDHPFEIVQATTLDQLKATLQAYEQIDILLCDVTMPEGQPTGIQVVQQLFPADSGTQVIYVSGHLEWATEVYITPHVYFLLKPVDPDKLSDALGKALQAIEHRQPPMVRLKVGHKERLINASTIVYLESSLHKVSVHCRNEVYETYAKLDDLCLQLPPSFSRCHRSFVINLACVSSLGENELHLYDGTVVPISRRRAKQVQHDMLVHLSAKA